MAIARSAVLRASSSRPSMARERGSGIRIESSLPKLLYGNNLSTVSNAQPALKRLREFTLDYVSGDLPDLYEMRYTRVDYCHNFALGDLLPDYASTLGKVCYLANRRTTGHANPGRPQPENYKTTVGIG